MKKKHCGKCSEEVTYFKCGRLGHYANECICNKKVCYGCSEEGHTAKYYPNKKEVAKPNMPPSPKARVF